MFNNSERLLYQEARFKNSYMHYHYHCDTIFLKLDFQDVTSDYAFYFYQKSGEISAQIPAICPNIFWQITIEISLNVFVNETMINNLINREETKPEIYETRGKTEA